MTLGILTIYLMKSIKTQKLNNQFLILRKGLNLQAMKTQFQLKIEDQDKAEIKAEEQLQMRL